MKKIFDSSLAIAKSSTIKDTSVLFFSNLTNAFFGFVLLLIIARAISVEEMGIFSAFTNLIILFSAICDPGISSGLVKFVAENRSLKKFSIEKKYISAGLKIQLVILAVISALLILFSEPAAKNLLATSNVQIVHVLIVATILQVLWLFSSQTLRARRKFLNSALVDISAGTARTILILALLLTSVLTLTTATAAYAFAILLPTLIGFQSLKINFTRINVEKKYYKSLLGFSGWIGVNKISSVIADKIDVQMVVLLAGATATGFYSVPSRLIFFISILVSSLSAVVSPRLAAFNDINKERNYIVKILMLSLVVVLGLISWYIFASPIINVLFGEKYMPSVPIFRLLIISMIPFVLTAAPVNAIIYGIKKPKYIGYFSMFQLLAVIFLNLLLIPTYGAIGATYTLILTNTILCIYTWSITANHYFTK